ncbi:hypothetical protein JHS3_14050 [Jeongeupia sp. HS-3]|uniref:hypothetical protein n=1 Tax=Jeongeupia sp. HS-3 TaxID=1009682 RepID=UPI0018A58DC4|nr:hypothetical protein [Jeongeupia sp. HS-3]BCL75669.1 hypothetical protein JHS3_14050 [Jeongeupia sp. HS-3]
MSSLKRRDSVYRLVLPDLFGDFPFDRITPAQRVDPRWIANANRRASPLDDSAHFDSLRGAAFVVVAELGAQLDAMLDTAEQAHGLLAQWLPRYCDDFYGDLPPPPRWLGRLAFAIASCGHAIAQHCDEQARSGAERIIKIASVTRRIGSRRRMALASLTDSQFIALRALGMAWGWLNTLATACYEFDHDGDPSDASNPGGWVMHGGWLAAEWLGEFRPALAEQRLRTHYMDGDGGLPRLRRYYADSLNAWRRESADAYYPALADYYRAHQFDATAAALLSEAASPQRWIAIAAGRSATEEADRQMKRAEQANGVIERRRQQNQTNAKQEHGNKRGRHAKVNPTDVMAKRAALIASGKAARETTSILAQQFGCTARYIRSIVSMKEQRSGSKPSV